MEWERDIRVRACLEMWDALRNTSSRTRYRKMKRKKKPNEKDEEKNVYERAKFKDWKEETCIFSCILRHLQINANCTQNSVVVYDEKRIENVFFINNLRIIIMIRACIASPSFFILIFIFNFIYFFFLLRIITNFCFMRSQ